ncbi:MAG TPA: hypothetical protein VGH69_21075, partial [Mycobacterium sp.]
MFFVNGETAKTYSALGEYAPDGPREGQAGSGGETQPPREFSIEELDSDTLNAELLHRLSFLARDRGMP